LEGAALLGLRTIRIPGLVVAAPLLEHFRDTALMENASAKSAALGVKKAILAKKQMDATSVRREPRANMKVSERALRIGRRGASATSCSKVLKACSKPRLRLKKLRINASIGCVLKTKTKSVL
jgi:hypothetical protein